VHWSLLIEFISALIFQWAALLTGGVVIAMVAVWEKFYGNIPPSAYLIVVVVTFVAACYLAWLKQKNAADAAECKIYVSQKRSEAKKQLATFHKEADKFIFSTLTRDSPQSEFDAWLSETNKWYNEVIAWVSKNLGEQALSKLTDIANPPIITWGRAINQNHNSTINNLIKIKENIGYLMESSAWDDFDTRVASSFKSCS
jgi:hypothetical protein